MKYKIYKPRITSSVVVDPYRDPAGLTYVSNSSMAHYGGKFWAVMDGTTDGFVENSPNQAIYLVTSTDGNTWSRAIRPFGDGAFCRNPISSTDSQWQPNMATFNNKLWCTWTGADGYISNLASPAGLWTNYRLEFSASGDPHLSPVVEGEPSNGRQVRFTMNGIADWMPFFSQNPVVLKSGDIVCPLTLYSKTHSSQILTADNFLRSLKRNAILRSRDGLNWTMTLLDTAAFGDFCAWEPFIVENEEGEIFVYSRNLNPLAADSDFLLVSRSTDGGFSFSPAVSAKMLVPSSRGFASQISNTRWAMVHADHRQGSKQTVNQHLSLHGRRNGAIFVSRRGADDFVPGVNFSGKDTSMNYPQLISVGGSLYINYTSGVGSDIRRSLRIVKVEPEPDDSIAYVHPRSASIYDSNGATAPMVNSDSDGAFYDFNAGGSQILSKARLTVESGITYAAWAKWDTGGEIIIDSRSSTATSFGQVFYIRGLSIGSLHFEHSISLRPLESTFLAATVDNSAQTVTTYVVAKSGKLVASTGYFRSIQILERPESGDILNVDGVPYTFKAKATGDADIAIADSATGAISNLRRALKARSIDSFTRGFNRVVMARADRAPIEISSLTPRIQVETGIPLSGGHLSVGRGVGSTNLTPYAGQLYHAAVYDTALGPRDVAGLYNSKAASFGYALLSESTAGAPNPLFSLDPMKPDADQYMSLGKPARCEVVSPSYLRIHGEASASVELPYVSTLLTFRFKLSAIPAGNEKFVIATFGSAESPARLNIRGSDPCALYMNSDMILTLSDPTAFNEVTVLVSSKTVRIGRRGWRYPGQPRCFLGNAYPENALSVSRSIDFDLSDMDAKPPPPLRRRPLI